METKRQWSPEAKAAASIRAKARWADGEKRKFWGDSIKKPPCCPDCGETDIAKFYVDKDGGRSNKVCRECHKIQCKERWHKKPAIDRQAAKAYKYGITPDKFLEMLEKQEGKCKICCTKPTTQRGLHVDHCHESGIVRGLLCHGCNVALGSMKDDPEILLKAVEYLRSHHGKPKYS
jgi:hypothetical protein